MAEKRKQRERNTKATIVNHEGGKLTVKLVENLSTACK